MANPIDGSKSFRHAVFVFGGLNDLGSEYHRALAEDPSTLCVACSRSLDQFGDSVILCPDSGRKELLVENRLFVDVGIDAKKSTRLFADVLAGLRMGEGPMDVTLIYTVGPFKFEHPNQRSSLQLRYLQADREILELNLRAFQELVKAMLRVGTVVAKKRGEQFHIKLVGFGSISDEHVPDMWPSYSLVKNVVRRRMQALVEASGKFEGVTLSGTMISTSTISTKSERALRPFAPEEEKRLWLPPGEIVRRTVDEIRNLRPGEYREQKIFNPWEGFKPEIYRSNPESLARWERQMNGEREDAERKPPERER